MDTATVSPRVRSFGPFEVSFDAGELRKNGLRLKLQEQPFQVLCLLLEHPGEIVAREELRQQLWPEGTFVDFEHGLNTAIKKIRDVLGDDPDLPRYIETVPRKGYRFMGTVNGAGAAKLPAAPEAAPRRRSRVPLLVLATLCVTVLMAVAIRSFTGAPHLRITSTKQLTFGGDVAPYSVIETDGRRVYYFKFSDGALYSVPVHGGSESSSPTRWVLPIILHISPDGSTLLVKEWIGPAGDTVDRLWLLPTNGGPARPLGDITADTAAFSPDGKSIAFARGRRMYFTDILGTTVRPAFEIVDEIRAIRYSPDGRRLRFSARNPATHVYRMWEASSDGSGQPAVLQLGGAHNTDRGIWTRKGDYFLFRSDSESRADYWIATDGRWKFGEGKISLFGGGGPQTLTAAASPLENGVVVTEYEESARSFTFDITKRKLSPFMSEMNVQNPVVSADNGWMVFLQVLNQQRVLWRVRRDGSEWTQLTDASLYVHHARISPDGKRIAMVAREPNGAWKIYWMSAEGGAIHKLEVPVSSQSDPNWMPDSDSIVFGQPPGYFAEPDVPRALYIASIRNKTFEKLTGTENWYSPRISKDGRSLLALSIDEHKLGLYDFASARWRTLLEESHRLEVPFWSPDGKWAYVNVVNRMQRPDLLGIAIHDGSMEKVVSLYDILPYPDCWGWGFASSQDGSIFISCVRSNANIFAVNYE